MAQTTTVGRLLVRDALPEDMRDGSQPLDKKGLRRLLSQLARQHPDQYREVSHRLAQIGHRVARETGGYSFGLEHLRRTPQAAERRDRIRGQLRRILASEDDDEQRNRRIVQLIAREMPGFQEAVYREALKDRNPLALQVQAGARGSPVNVQTLLAGDLMYTDPHDQPVPVPILRSYAEGLTPAEYFAGTYGARKGVLATKLATREGGALAKVLNQITHRLAVTALDEDEEDQEAAVRGLPVSTDDPDNAGALLAQTIGPYERNTPLTPKILHHLQQLGHDQVLVRSPAAGRTPPSGGLYARDVGLRETGRLPERGSLAGMTAAQALSEPITQGALGAKHGGGVAGEDRALSGFDRIKNLIQTPKSFKGGAAHAENDGVVAKIEDAPAGGRYVHINGQRHHVPQGLDLRVKRGDRVEAGDVLSDGLPNPSLIVQHKGVGEGRRYFTETFRGAMREAGVDGHRRNIELLARGLIDHVRMTDEWGDHAPDDVVPYSEVERSWQPREDHERMDLSQAEGRYLERPVLHYSIGTRVTPKVVEQLRKFGVQQVDAHRDPPPFRAEMIKGMNILQHDPDWMTRLYGSGQKRSLLSATHRGAVSDETGTSFVPSMARATDFGRSGQIVQPQPWPKEGLDDLAKRAGALLKRGDDAFKQTDQTHLSQNRSQSYVPPKLSPYSSHPSATGRFQGQVYGGQDHHARPTAYGAAADQGWTADAPDQERLAEQSWNLRAPAGSRLRFVSQPREVSRVRSARPFEGPWGPEAIVGADPPSDGDRRPGSRGLTAVHEIEHVTQGTPESIRNDARRALGEDDYHEMAGGPVEIPASLSELAHLGESVRGQSGPQATANVHVPLGPDGQGMNLHVLWQQARDFGHLGGDKSVTELLNTPQGQGWLRYWLQRHEKGGSDDMAKRAAGMYGDFADQGWQGPGQQPNPRFVRPTPQPEPADEAGPGISWTDNPVTNTAGGALADAALEQGARKVTGAARVPWGQALGAAAKRAPAWGAAIETGTELYGGYHRGREMGYGHLASPFVGYHARAQDWANRRTPSSLTGYLGQVPMTALQAWGSPQAVYATGSQAAGAGVDATRSFGSQLEQNYQRTPDNTRALQDVDQNTWRDDSDPRSDYERVFVPDSWYERALPWRGWDEGRWQWQHRETGEPIDPQVLEQAQLRTSGEQQARAEQEQAKRREQAEFRRELGLEGPTEPEPESESDAQPRRPFVPGAGDQRYTPGSGLMNSPLYRALFPLLMRLGHRFGGTSVAAPLLLGSIDPSALRTLTAGPPGSRS